MFLAAGSGFPLTFGAVLVGVVAFVISFAMGKLPGPRRKVSRKWIGAWLRASAYRLGIAAGIGLAVFGMGSLLGLGASSPPVSVSKCDAGVKPLTAQPVTAARIQSAAAALSLVGKAASNGDLAGASADFFKGDTHNLTHDIDPPLRAKTPAVAKQFCRAIVALEVQFPGQRDMTVIEREANAAAVILQNMPAMLGLSPSPAAGTSR